MKVWITSFFVLFCMAELYQWLSHFTVPLPVFLLTGAVLAIASNYNQFTRWFFRDSKLQMPLGAEDSVNSLHPTRFNPSVSTPVLQPPRSISFTINPVREHKPIQDNDSQQN